MKYTVNSYEDAGQEQVGAKAWNLLQLTSKFRVPEFLVITTKAFKENEREERMTPELEGELKIVLSRFLEGKTVAIRSSCTAEDLPGISFAGMYTTVLNVKDMSSGLSAIIQVWDSIDSQRVKKYRKQMNASRGDMAVIIQHQLQPEVSGVMVTQSPFSVSEVLIECCPGLGEKLVSGEITPTRYRIKSRKIVEHKGDNLLSDTQLRELTQAGKKIEKIFGSGQDIEWAIENEKLYILQSRPVTVHAAEPRRRGTVWCNANVRETIPDPISPMGWSIFDTVFFPEIIMYVFGLPVSRQKYDEFRPVELISGRLYWNVNNTISYGKSVGPILNFMEGDRSLDPQMAQAFKAVDIKNLRSPIPTFTMLCFSTVALIRMSHYIALGFCRFRWMSAKVKKAHDTLDVIADKLEPANDLATGVNNIREWMEFIAKKFTRRYFGGLFLSIFSLIVLSKLLGIRMGKKGEVLARKTVFGILDRTGEMALTLRDLAARARQKTNKMTLSNLKRLYEKDIEFRDHFDAFIKEFGHRGPAEFDIASINWREDHNMVFSVMTTATDDRSYRIDRKAIVHNIMNDLGSFERCVLRIFVPRIEALMPLRENGKDKYLKVMAKIKDQLFVMERILIRQGYIANSRDIFFLTLEDLDRLLAQRSTKNDILELVKKRKDEWKTYRQAKAPDIVFESGERVFAASEESAVLSGEPLSFGRIKARARVVKNFKDSVRLKEGEILVTHHTDPGWTPLFTIASGVVIEVGVIICHAAMVARELGVPAVVIRNATALIPDGSLVELDADTGKVIIMSKTK